MSHIRVLIRRVDDPASDQMTELASFDLPATDVSASQPEVALNELETTTQETGNAILRRTIQAQWELIDAELTDQHRRSFPPSGSPRCPLPLRVGSGRSRSPARSVRIRRRRPR